MKSNLRLAIVTLSAVMTFSAMPAGAAEQDFAKPKQGANRLDWCYDWGVGCGKQAADAWCKAKGFEESSVFAIASDIGANQPTRLIGTGAVCDQAYCDGFTHITCKTSTPQKMTFNKPKIQGNRLDWCYNWATGCGSMAANTFCASKGYAAATGFAMAADIGANQPTRLIGTGAVCDQQFCDGFKFITCAK
jgi:hypothetical protein